MEKIIGGKTEPYVAQLIVDAPLDYVHIVVRILGPRGCNVIG
jgi:hypothetical protein